MTRSAEPGQTRARPGSDPELCRECNNFGTIACLASAHGGELAAEGVIVEPVDERSLAVDLDHRQPLAVARLELGVAADVDLRQLESQLALQPPHLIERPLAEVAALRVEDRDPRYG
jgi:hypothetical protein